MISIIIPSRDSVALKSISKNIANTIGVPFEIIDYDNSEDGIGICKIYNLCAQKAQYDYLVFCHDDILFHTNNWGIDLIALLSTSDITLVGVAGAIFKSKFPLSWVSAPKELYRSNAFYYPNFPKENNRPNNLFSEVVVLDGMFLGMTKQTWEKYKFNEKDLKAFHLYDIDLAYRLRAEGKIVVSHKILIEHKSRGNFNLNWFSESKRWHQNKLLPIFTDQINTENVRELEIISQGLYLNYLIELGINTLHWPKEYISLCRKTKKLKLGILYKIIQGLSLKVRRSVDKCTASPRRTILNRILKKRVENKEICIISNNCWGGDVYEALNLEYNTPFIGLFINAPCYIKLLSNFSYYMNCDLKFKEASIYKIPNIKYPIGILDDIEIHFLHYKSEDEAYQKWNRRKNRMPENPQDFLYKIDDRDFATEQEIIDFHALPFSKKVSFTKEDYRYEQNVKLKKPGDFILLYSTYGIVDLALFLNEGIVKNTSFNKVLSKIINYPSKWI